jgi:hypothetical protein
VTSPLGLLHRSVRALGLAQRERHLGHGPPGLEALQLGVPPQAAHHLHVVRDVLAERHLAWRKVANDQARQIAEGEMSEGRTKVNEHSGAQLTCCL